MFVDKFSIIYILFLTYFTNPKKIKFKDFYKSMFNLIFLRLLLYFSFMIWKPINRIEIISILYQLLFFSVCEEFYTYFLHNHSYLYLKIHKKHAEGFRLAFYMSNYEIVFLIYPSITIGTWLIYFMGFHINNIALQILYCTSLFYFLWRTKI